MKFAIFFIFLLFQTNHSYRTRRLTHLKKLPHYNIDLKKNRLQLAKLMAPKHKILKRVMPDIQMDKNGYYKIDKYRQFLQQNYKKNRKNDVVQFKTANLYREHNLYHPSDQAIKRIAKQNAFKKMQKQKKFQRASAWKAFQKMGMRKSFLRHIPKKRERRLKQLKKKNKKKMDIVLRKFQELFGTQSLKRKPRRLAEQQQNVQTNTQQPKVDEKQQQTPAANQQKPLQTQQKEVKVQKKDIRQTPYLKRKVLLDEIRNQYHSIKRMQKELKILKLRQEATKKKYDFKGRKLLQVIKRMRRERRLEQTYVLTNVNLEYPDFDFEFLNGQKSIFQYKRIQNLDYSLQKSVENFSYYYYLFSECLQITQNEFKWSEIDDDPRTKHCRSRYAYLIMILRNVFLKTENMILKLLPKVIVYDKQQKINKRDFFLGMVQQKYFSYQKTIDTISHTVEDIENLTIGVLTQKKSIQQLLLIAKISDNFTNMRKFAIHLDRENLARFLDYLNNECTFYQELNSLVIQYTSMKEGRYFLSEFQKTLQKETQSRNLVNKEKQAQIKKDVGSIDEVTKFLKSNSNNYEQLIKNEKSLFKTDKNFVSDKQKRQLLLLDTINNVLKRDNIKIQQTQDQSKLLNKLFKNNSKNKLEEKSDKIDSKQQQVIQSKKVTDQIQLKEKNQDLEKHQAEEKNTTSNTEIDQKAKAQDQPKTI